jgi:sulfoxide reductase heme-binding subunit YedZ
MTRRGKFDSGTIGRLLKVAAHIGALVPLGLLLWDYATFQLSADPIREATLRTGRAALTLLILSLACTPLNIIFGWKQLLPLRRTLGLYAFLYASLHGFIFVWIDYGLDPGLIAEAIFQKRYALAGLTTFLLLVPLALTSNRRSMRRLGKKWKLLHRLAYVAGILAVVHFLWLVKQAYTRPVIYASVLALLLIVRMGPIKQTIMGWRTELKNRRVGRPTSVGQ